MSFIVPAVFVAAMALLFAAISNASSAKRGDGASEKTISDTGIFCAGMGCSGCMHAPSCSKSPQDTVDKTT